MCERNEISIRLMTEADVDAAAEIEKASIPDPWSKNSFLQALSNPQAICIVCTGDCGEVDGYAVIYFAADEGELVTIAVREECRGRYLGAALLEKGHSLASKKGAASIYLEVRESNMPAQGLYHSFGYEVCGKRKNFYSNPTEDAILMRLPLDTL